MTEKIALVFSGIGTHWTGMAESLLVNDAVFRDTITEVDALLTPLQGWSVLTLLSGRPAGVAPERPEIAHPAIFSVQIGLTRCLLARGVRPVAVIGHSAGEVAAAWCAGALTLAEAVQVVAAQSALISAVDAGAMLHVALDPASLARRIEAADTGLELAAINSPLAAVVAGPPEAIAAFEASLRADAIDTRLLGIRVPLHTRAVEPQQAAFTARLAGLRAQRPGIAFYSSLRGALAQEGDFDAAYWARHIRDTVRFPDAAEALFEAGVTRCIEVSPHPALLQHLSTIAGTRAAAITFEPTLQRDMPEPLWPGAASGSAEAAPDAALDAATVERVLRASAADILGAGFAFDLQRQHTWIDIGCTSLQITRLMARLSELLGKRLSITLPYRFPTPAALIAGLSAAVSAHEQTRPAPDASASIAIVGMACRLPGGANDPAALWDLLSSGTDPITEIPPERWPAAAFYDADPSVKGRSVSRWGGFISGQDLRDFDARHFRMTPREAGALDPQQRLLLEVTWEALENAGYSVPELKGTQVGVYVALSTDDYKNSTLYHDIDALDSYAGAGAMSCTAAGRLSYYFGWEGPNLAIDTACSGSIVALHLACQALKSGECDVAVVGGVNALLTPHLYVYFSKAGIMSPTGRCHVFDDAADGYVRAEGCGMLVLQRESDAVRDARPLRARVLGSALNQDGASSGFSAPNGAAQQKVLRQAWRQAGVSADDIGYLEAHGTGTVIGDSIELEAMSASVSPQRSASDPMPVGSLKSNLGHLEAAAGLGAVIKTVLALEHRQLPANLHFDHPNAHIDWNTLPLRVVDQAEPFPERNGRRVAGISSFGFSGTNAHVVLEQAAPQTSAAARPVQVLALSAHDREGLRALARSYARRATGMAPEALADLAASSHQARPCLPSRLALAASADQVAPLLQRWAEQPADGEQIFSTDGHAGPLVFAFTGQGCQYPGMAQALYQDEPVFRAVLDRCEAALLATGSGGMLGALLDPLAPAATLEATECAQPAIYAVQCGLAALLAAWGVKPDRVVGHSVGEFAAAVSAGVLALEDGLTLVAQRARLMASMPAGGAMASVQVDEDSALAAIGSDAGGVAVAAINGKRAVVLSGPAQALEAVLARLGAPGARAKRLQVSHAYHSPAMASAAQQFAGVAAPRFAAASIPWISSVDARDFADNGPDMAYWSAQMTSPVRFDAALDRLEADGCRSFLEIGPAAVLTQIGRARGGEQPSFWLPVQERQKDARLSTAIALAALAAHGFAIDWNARDALAGRRRVDLPPYPFQRKRLWREPAIPAVSQRPDVFSTDAGQAVVVAHALQKDTAMANAVPASHAVEAVATIRDMVAELTGMASAEIDPDAALLDLGLDSLMLVQMKTLMAGRLGITVDMADFYGDLDTVARLAQLVPAGAGAAPPQPASAPQTDSAQAAPPPTVHAAPLVDAPFVSAAMPAVAGAGFHSTGTPHTDLARLMALQLDAMSRMISEQNALLARAPQAAYAPPPAAAPAPLAAAKAPVAAAGPVRSGTPNFRSLKLDADTMTAEQQSFVDALARRYAARTPSSKALAERSRHNLADWKNTLSFRYSLKEMMYPIVAQTSHGSHFIDLDGNDFIDLTMGCGIALLGHSPEAITRAVHAQVDAHFAIGPQTALAADVAAHFSRITGLERVTFCNTGAEAVMMATRMARAVTGRTKVVIFNGAYHGTWDGVLGVEHDGHVHPIGAGTPQGMVDDLVVLNYGTDEALAALREQAHEIAAVLVEPVQSRRPGFQPAEFLKQLRVITEECGAALIVDEMITGFRILPGGSQAYFGVKADLATYGKIVGGGLPLAVVAGSPRFMDAVDGGDWQYGDTSKPESDVIYFGGTYIKHPLALAAAKAALTSIDQLGLAGYAALNARTARLVSSMNAWFASESVPLTIANFGSQFRIDGSGRYSTVMQPVELDLFFLLVNLRSVYIWERRICFLSFAHTDAEVDHVMACMKEAVLELRAAGFSFRTGGTPPAPGGGKAPALSVGAAAPALRTGKGEAASAQRRMFALSEIEGPGVVYNVPLAISMRGPLDLVRLQRSLATLVERHPALRTRFVVEDDALVQEVLDQCDASIEQLDCTEAELRACLDRLVRPFDLKTAPLFRTALLRVSPARHVLLMDAHHIVVDGLSLNILAQELMAAYGGQALAEVGAGMIEYAASEQVYRNSDACQRDARYWQGQFATLPEPLQLPLDQARPLRRHHKGADLLAKLDAVTTARLKAAARIHKMPLFPLLLTLYATLLHRVSGQDDIVIGLPVGGRGDARFGSTVGMLAATLPLRFVAAPQDALALYARACHRAFLGALGHQAYPLEALIASLELPRDTSRNPLFDTMFIYEDGNDRVYRMDGLECEPAHVSRHAAMFDIAMEVIEAEGELTLRCEYDTDLFSAASAQGMLDTYLRLLHLAPDMLDQPVGQLDLLDARQRSAVLAWGDGGPATPPATILQAFDAQLAHAPDAAALICNGVTTTYRQLDARANRLAHALQAGLEPQSPVALVARRDLGLVAGLLAILRAGAAYVPIDPDFPAPRVRQMFEASRCMHILASADLIDSVPTLPGARILSLDAGHDEQPASAPAGAPAPDHLAYLIFTSGSTGTPKATMVSHANAAALFASLPQAFGFAPGQRILGVTTASFDIAALELLGSLCCGMTIVLASAHETREPELLADLIERERVEVVQMTPTRLQMLLEAAPAATSPLAPVRTLLVGGEALPQALADTLSRMSGTRVFNVYGPTETTIWSAYWQVSDAPVSLGRPFPGERVLLLSPQWRMQPPGAVGQIAICGAGVARGYLHDEERTAERFIRLPGIDGPVYLTGDLGRWRSDGSLEFLGRRDDQVKVRGMRIEIGDIEYHLARLPGVTAAAAAVRQNARGEAEIHAWLVGPTAGIDVAAIRSALAAHLPAPMIPARFMLLAALPQTPNGKTDRRGLPEPDLQARQGGAARLPNGPAEQALVAIFSEVLGSAVGPEDDFFLAGGESIRALRLASRIRAAGLAFELQDLFRWPTPAALAANLARHAASAAPVTANAIGSLSGLADDELADLIG